MAIKIGPHQKQIGAENPEEGADRIEPEYVVSWRHVQERAFAMHQSLADERDISFVGEIQAVPIDQTIIDERKQNQSRTGDEGVSSSIQCVHLKIRNSFCCGQAVR